MSEAGRDCPCAIEYVLRKSRRVQKLLDSVLRPVSGVLEWVFRRSTRGVIVHVYQARRAGSEEDPVLHVEVKVENPQGENAFVSNFVVEMLEPFSASASRYEYRSDSNTRISRLALNVLSHGIAGPVIVIAFFSEHLPLSSGCRARIAAIGRGHFRRRWQEFVCGPLE